MSAGATKYGDFDVVNEQTPQYQDTGAQSRPAKIYSCMARSWPRLFLVGSIIVAVLTFVSIIFNFIKVAIHPATVMLNIYCLIFSLLALSAELRQFGWCRKIVYIWIRYVYFLAYYKPRGLFYVFFGLLLMGDSVLMYVAGAVAIVIGIIMLLTSVFADLPVYTDAKEEARIQEEYVLYLQSKANIPLAGAGVGAKLGSAFDTVTSKFTGKDKHEASADGAGGVPPPAVQQEANTGAYQAPAVTQPAAKAAPAPFRDTSASDEDEDAAANKPPRREPSGGSYSPLQNANASGVGAFAASNANMFGSSAQTSTVARPLQEAGIVRGGLNESEPSAGAGSGESELRREFNARMEDKADDLR